MEKCPNCGKEISYPKMLLAQYGISCKVCGSNLSSSLKTPFHAICLLILGLVFVWLLSFFVPAWDNKLYMFLGIAPIWFFVPFVLKLQVKS